MSNKLLALAAVAALTTVLNATASAQVIQDENGELHYKMCKAGQTIMKAEDMTSNGFWLRPVDEIQKTKFTPRPVNEIMGMTDAEFDAFSNSEGNRISGGHKRSDVVIIPVNEILGLTNAEYDAHAMSEGNRLPNRIIKPGSGYNPETWGYTPKGYTMAELVQHTLKQ